MRIEVVGPTHPYRGGVAAHTTRTARALADTPWLRYTGALTGGRQPAPAAGAR